MFISQLDPFNEQHSAYHVKRSLAETEMTVYNGLHEIYVNTAVNDGTLIAELMQYFENSNGINPNFEKLSTRVEELKESEEGVKSMSSVFDEFEKSVAIQLLKEGFPVEKIAKAISSISVEELKQLEREELQKA